MPVHKTLHPYRQLPASLQPNNTPITICTQPQRSGTIGAIGDTHSTHSTDDKTTNLYIKKASFSTEDIDALGGTAIRRNSKTIKRNTKRNLSMKRIQFIMPSRKRMQRETRDEVKKSMMVQKMDSGKLNHLLKGNKLIKHESKAPDELKRNIAKSVFL